MSPQGTRTRSTRTSRIPTEMGETTRPQTPVARQVPTCAQCGTRSSEVSDSEHGLLCLRCAYRQNEHDNRRDGIEP